MAHANLPSKDETNDLLDGEELGHNLCDVLSAVSEELWDRVMLVEDFDIEHERIDDDEVGAGRDLPIVRLLFLSGLGGAYFFAGPSPAGDGHCPWCESVFIAVEWRHDLASYLWWWWKW